MHRTLALFALLLIASACNSLEEAPEVGGAVPGDTPLPRAEAPPLSLSFRAQSDEDAPSSPGGDPDEEARIAEAIANPLSYLWLLFMQNDSVWYDGDLLDDLDKDPKVQNSFLLNPVLSVQLTETWKTIIRPVVPILSFNTVGNVNLAAGSPGEVTGVDRERETGLGDIVLWTAFSKQYEPPNIFGFGPTVIFDTATDDNLGSGKSSAGPMALAFRITDRWILGLVAQHWWSFAGDDTRRVDTDAGSVKVDRADVNLTDVQYVVRYRLSNKTNIGMAPNARYDWEADQLSLPIGIGVDSLFKIGPLPVKIGVEGYYFVERDDDLGPEWQLRILFVPVIPAPAWSRTPLF